MLWWYFLFLNKWMDFLDKPEIVRYYMSIHTVYLLWHDFGRILDRNKLSSSFPVIYCVQYASIIHRNCGRNLYWPHHFNRIVNHQSTTATRCRSSSIICTFVHEPLIKLTLNNISIEIWINQIYCPMVPNIDFNLTYIFYKS